jgi:four helix bundle protein
MDFAEDVHRLTRKFPREEMFGLTSQLRRAVVSVPSNIAEGQGRGGRREFVQFLHVSNGSLQEAETQRILANRFDSIAADVLEALLERTAEIGRINSGLIRSIGGRR